MRPGGLDLRLVVPAVAAWLAAGILVVRPSAGWWCVASCVVLIGLIAALGVARGPRRVGGVIVVLTAIGLTSAATALVGSARHPAALDTLANGHAATVEARVDSMPRAVSGGPFGGPARLSFRVTASSVTLGHERIVAKAPALVSAPRGRGGPRIGERVLLRGVVTTAPPSDGIAFTVHAESWRLSAASPWWLSWANGLRERFTASTAQLPGEGGELLPGLSIGDETRVSAGLDDRMKAASLSHLTAVSGSNCAVIVAGVLAIAGAFGAPRRLRIAAALLGLAAFVVLVTPGASVLRAAVMAGIVLIGTASGRPGRALPALSLAVLALLVQNPWMSRDYGFALSVLATAALLVLAPPLARALQRWLPAWLATALAVPLAAQLACQPVLVMLNPSLPLYGVIANLLAEPAAPVATILGLIACLLLPAAGPFTAPLLWAAWLPSAWIAGIARTSTALPGSALPWPLGAMGVILAAALTVATAALVMQTRTRHGLLVRRVIAAGTALLLVMAVSVQLGAGIAVRAAMPRDWTVGLCDVGQGDAVVLHDGDEYGLIDTGPEPKSVSACMSGLGVHRLALLVLTHYDADHVGGVAGVSSLAEFALVDPPPDAVAERRLAPLREHGVPMHVAARGDAGSLGRLRWRVLWPDTTHPGLSSSNERGVALEVDGAGVRMLFLADLDAKAQDALIADGAIAGVDIVKVAHHGSADQSRRLYGILHARLGLISCGLANSYGHPTAGALRLLQAAGTAVARTDVEGTVLVTARDGRLALWSRRAPDDAALWAPARRDGARR